MKPHLTLAPDEPDICMNAALRALQHRWHGERELIVKLEEKGFSVWSIALVLERLRADGWIDDARFAESHARSRARKGHGRQRIRRELQSLGVAERTAADAVATVLSDDTERQSLVALCRKKMRMMASRHGASALHQPEARKKLTAYLLTRGYEHGEVSAVIRQELQATEKD